MTRDYKVTRKYYNQNGCLKIDNLLPKDDTIHVLDLSSYEDVKWILLHLMDSPRSMETFQNFGLDLGIANGAK